MLWVLTHDILYLIINYTTFKLLIPIQVQTYDANEVGNKLGMYNTSNVGRPTARCKY